MLHSLAISNPCIRATSNQHQEPSGRRSLNFVPPQDSRPCQMSVSPLFSPLVSRLSYLFFSILANMLKLSQKADYYYFSLELGLQETSQRNRNKRTSFYPKISSLSFLRINWFDDSHCSKWKLRTTTLKTFSKPTNEVETILHLRMITPR